MEIDGHSLDRYITGNWGEDSVAPDFVKARELGDFEMGQKVVIDATSSRAGESITVTVEKVSIKSWTVFVYTEELAWPLAIPEDATVWLAGD